MKIKHFTHTSDFTREDYLNVFKIAEKLEERLNKKKDLTNFCRGKVLGVAFLKESTRTLAAFQSAIIKLGGGWMGLTTKKGTYLESGEEDIEDTLSSLAQFSDLIVIRSDEVNLDKLKREFKIPIINALAKDEHSINGLCFVYFLKKKFGDLSKIKVGFYGMTGASRPTKASYRVLSLFGTQIYEDSVVEGLGISQEIEKEINRFGPIFKRAKLEDFISQVDFLWIVEGIPQAGTPENLVSEFNKKVKIIGLDEINKLKKGALFYVCQPRQLTDGRFTVDKVIDKHPRNTNFLGTAFLPGIIATIVYLLGVKIR
ncbi:MAG: hypothetical protein ACK413_03040 [Patescibacteria group bacterium]